ncbi:predicted protein [Uncinocarpus reesii 1704]|uniref:Aminoglycoside phosphotransferase domain-containing protein n=1 Tax=Uncinocarpus reesii (strain UAMH 1704) TaxID=336963 RepID=C4JTV8_UNCRE|nr:uncharacterized protein UREG_05897 [Uncinocarpus reesii 1704]EEP81055.1 predicted protein [Uncinocarpus reesii 1704]
MALAPVTNAECMEFDSLASDRGDEIFAKWKTDTLFNRDILRKAGTILADKRGGVPDTLLGPRKGAFNVFLRMTFGDGRSAIIRFPCPSTSMFPEEKLKREISVMRFLEQHMSFSVPHVLGYGTAEESPSNMGPFVVMDYLDHEHDLVDALNIPDRPGIERPVLYPEISEDRLKLAYGQMSDILLQMHKPSFSRIGCIGREDEDDDFDDVWTARYRPLTLNMNELVQMGNLPRNLLPQSTFETASSYYLALAEMHMDHLQYQRNDAIHSAEDCRQKYIARCLFRKLARERRLCKYDHGPFKLFCDDFRPANVLADAEFRVTGAVDWEFTYAAPAEFARSPPFWLLLELPEYWPEGLDDWTQKYERRLKTFLEALQEKEEHAIRRGIITENDRLSRYMKESWETGDFWVNYAARRSWAFDMIYWAKIDRRFFGAGDLEDRFRLLTKDEREGIGAFIERKLAEKEDRKLKDWESVTAPLNG